MTISGQQKNLWQYSIIILLCLAFYLCIGCISLLSQTASAVAVTNQKGLTLSPLRSELETAPGTSLEGALTVKNATEVPMTVRLNAEEFNVTNQQYDYAFTAESNVAKWVRFASDEVKLETGESKNINYTIGVPLSAEPGGRYISLFASTDADVQSGGVNSQQRVASLTYLTVSGDVSREGRLVSIASPWLISGTSQWSAALQNTGSTHYRSRYNVNIQNIFGNRTITSTSGDALILPGTVRSVTDQAPLPSLPGIYKLIYTIGLGDSPAAIQTRLVLYVPPLATAIISFTIIIVASLFLRKRRSKH